VGTSSQGPIIHLAGNQSQSQAIHARIVVQLKWKQIQTTLIEEVDLKEADDN